MHSQCESSKSTVINVPKLAIKSEVIERKECLHSDFSGFKPVRRHTYDCLHVVDANVGWNGTDESD